MMSSLKKVTQEIQQGMDNGELRIKKIYSERDGKEVKYVIDVSELDKEETESTLSVKVEVDTKEANENIKELTAAANECVEALERLEKVVDQFNKKGDSIEMNAPLTLDGRAIAEATLQFQRDLIRAKPF
ncbi:hypothetical protein [Bacillus toyonensis]|uniref:hypothetical protein n=1 Tax=Bacillus toyonensis TaxID=155322 RepID=UPI0020D2703E|nr:hypothetical protein [Bacillus toyonensis]